MEFLGGILGLIGVGISIYFSVQLHKDSIKYQKEMDESNKEFQQKLDNRNKEFQKEINKKEEQNKLWLRKHQLLINLISYRHDVLSEEYSKAMNGIPAVFYDSKEVLDATKSFYNYLTFQEKDQGVVNDKLVKIYEEMFKNLGIEQDIDKVFLQKVFNLVN